MAELLVNQFYAQDLANTTWAFATVGQKDELLFNALARMAERRLDQFNAQDLANTTAGGGMGVFNERGILMTLWAFSHCESLGDAWSLFEYAKSTGTYVSPLCFEALLAEHKYRGSFEH